MIVWIFRVGHDKVVDCRFCWHHPDPNQKACDTPEEVSLSLYYFNHLLTSSRMNVMLLYLESMIARSADKDAAT
jgi:hypothetical protein